MICIWPDPHCIVQVHKRVLNLNEANQGISDATHKRAILVSPLVHIPSLSENPYTDIWLLVFVSEIHPVLSAVFVVAFYSVEEVKKLIVYRTLKMPVRLLLSFRNQKMKIVSLLYADWIREEELATHQHSDRIWMPAHMFQRWLLEETEGSLVIADLGGVGVCVYGPHGGDANILYAPEWICQALHVSGEPEPEGEDYIIPIRIRPAQCLYVKVQPHTSQHIELAESTQMPAEDILARGFEQYTCLQKGKTITLHLESGDELMVDVLDTLPDTEDILCIRAGEIELELLPPLDLLQSTLNSCKFIAAPATVQEPAPVVSAQTTQTETREERRAKLAAAALARFSNTNKE